MERPNPPTTTAIRPINKAVVHRICSGQVILDLSSAVKELVENSLDAGATSIEIALKDHGEDSFQVIDNGSGISPDNFQVLALKHHTSKLMDFPDLQNLATFGFRGEALSSLCALGEMTVETRTNNEVVGTHLTFDHSGLLKGQRKTARQVGTTVTVRKLFSNLPVRSKEFKRNIRKEFGKLVSLLNAYAVIARGVRIVCTNTTGKNVKSVVLKTQGSDSIKDNIITVLGMNTFSCLEPVCINISDGCKVDGFLSKPGQGSGRNLGDRQYYFVNGRPVDMPKVSKLVNELYKGANSRQYPIAILNFTIPTTVCDVNVTPDKRKVFFSDENSIMFALRDGLQKIYSPSNVSYSVNKLDEKSMIEDSSNSKLCSIQEKSKMVLQKSSADTCDGKVNYEKEHKVEGGDSFKTSEIRGSRMENSDEKLMKDFALRVHGLKNSDSSLKSSSRLPSNEHETVCDQSAPPLPTAVDKSGADATVCSIQSTLKNFVTVNKRKHEDLNRPLSEVPVLRNLAPQEQLKAETHPTESILSADCMQADDLAELTDIEPSKRHRRELIFRKIRNSLLSRGTNNAAQPLEEPATNETASPTSELSISSPDNGIESLSEDILIATPPLQTPGPVLDAPLPSSQKIFSPLKFSFAELKTRRQQRLSRLQSSCYNSGEVKISRRSYVAATLELSQSDNEERKAKALAAATTELERLFRKADFSKMKVIGQFNLGFIIGKIDHDVFIVDQHAADEKYNFERLCQSTVLNQQPLLRPLRLELSPEEEIVASMNLDIIRKNGFTLEEDPQAPPGLHFRLKAVPFSKNLTFGVEDIKDLISTLADSEGESSVFGTYKMDSSDSVCPSKVRAMLASRACRSSVMIGDPLGRNEMQKILEHLADLRSPWNCPHGRPTMRHLIDLTSIYRRYEEEDATIL